MMMIIKNNIKKGDNFTTIFFFLIILTQTKICRIIVVNFPYNTNQIKLNFKGLNLKNNKNKLIKYLAIALITQTINIAEIAIIKVRLTTESTTLSLDGGHFEFKESLVSFPVYTTRQTALKIIR